MLKPREEGSAPQRVMVLTCRLQERTAALKSFRAQRAFLHLLSRQLSLFLASGAFMVVLGFE